MYQKEGYSHRSNMRQLNTSLQYCRHLGQCNRNDATQKLNKKFELQEANIALGLKNMIATHPNTSPKGTFQN
tara:strand:- start:1331 stop:1546 length:216 start_codon:yes stop_codon:yes gene_type:complete